MSRPISEETRKAAITSENFSGVMPYQVRGKTKAGTGWGESAATRRAIEEANRTSVHAPIERCLCGRPVEIPEPVRVTQKRQTPVWLAVTFGLVLGIGARECASTPPTIPSHAAKALGAP